MRMMHEAAYWEITQGRYSIFVTLTYDDENLPLYGTLVKEHIQDFFKRLWWKVTSTKLRYYVVGEYGSQCPYHELIDCPKCGSLQRPHYHAIIFGWSAPEGDQSILGHRDGMTVYESKILGDAWKFGSHEYGTCTFESCAYVARYTLKKFYGNEYDKADHYCKHMWQTDTWIDLPPEFAMMSKRPGIGKLWFDEYYTSVYHHDEAPIPGRSAISKPGRYYDSHYEKINPEHLAEIKEDRRHAMAKSLVEGPSLESRAIYQDAQLALTRRTL